MINTKDIAIEEYNYPLPDERIAKYPLPQRDQSKLLIYRKGDISEKQFTDLPEALSADSLIVFNNTKVIQARMHFYKATGARIEIFCLEPHIPNDYNLSFQSTSECSWVCMIGNAKKWKEDTLFKNIEINGRQLTIEAHRVATEGKSQIVRFVWDDPQITFAEILDAIGELPIPPYLNRDTQESDKETYQTVYSKIEGSVAAPTAGLHFTDRVFDALKSKGITTQEVTLHVGAGTFQPVKSEKIAQHEMHTEFISVEKAFLQKLINHQGPVVAVGTTSVRTLESLYYIGVNLLNGVDDMMRVLQWQPYQAAEKTISKNEALQAIIDYLTANELDQLHSATQIMIAPGYQFRIVDAIVTNFHQPQSTLLLLISACIGQDWKRVYDYALQHDFRFLSYGDSSLIIP